MVRGVRMKDGFARVPYREIPREKTGAFHIYVCGTGAPCFIVLESAAATSRVATRCEPSGMSWGGRIGAQRRIRLTCLGTQICMVPPPKFK